MMDAASVPSNASTLLDVLDHLRSRGYTGSAVADVDGTLRCLNCEARHDVSQLAIDGYHRIEGASDAADLSLIVWTRCDTCDTGMTAVLGYGPNAGAADAAILTQLDISNAAPMVVTPPSDSAHS